MSQALDCTIPTCLTCAGTGQVPCDLGGLSRRCEDCKPKPAMPAEVDRFDAIGVPMRRATRADIEAGHSLSMHLAGVFTFQSCPGNAMEFEQGREHEARSLAGVHLALVDLVRVAERIIDPKLHAAIEALKREVGDGDTGK